MDEVELTEPPGGVGWQSGIMSDVCVDAWDAGDPRCDQQVTLVRPAGHLGSRLRQMKICTGDGPAMGALLRGDIFNQRAHPSGVEMRSSHDRT